MCEKSCEEENIGAKKFEIKGVKRYRGVRRTKHRKNIQFEKETSATNSPGHVHRFGCASTSGHIIGNLQPQTTGTQTLQQQQQHHMHPFHFRGPNFIFRVVT